MKFSGAEFVNLLRSLPQPDEEYLAIVEDLIIKQPKVAESGRQRLSTQVKSRDFV